MLKRRVKLALRYCVTAWLAILCGLLLMGMVVCFGMAVYTQDFFWLKTGGIVAGALAVGVIAFLIESPMVRCLMCGGAMLRPLRCARHKEARRLLGSTTLHSCLRLAVFPKSLDCPYCGGHYKLTSDGKVRSRREVSK
ncbi:MAG: hypothetical protein O3A87_09595 [Verrucomicrobia bacterium]|nr:hypothetical protein [Verrucomicrobiota bacterium]MDA1006712.1 hypothetical protein [Verrucomicrobiota bacterium]